MTQNQTTNHATGTAAARRQQLTEQLWERRIGNVQFFYPAVNNGYQELIEACQAILSESAGYQTQNAGGNTAQQTQNRRGRPAMSQARRQQLSIAMKQRHQQQAQQQRKTANVARQAGALSE